MVSKNQLKLIKSLHQKKYRIQHQLFFVEGVKAVRELLDSDLEVEELLVTPSNMQAFSADKAQEVSEEALKKISALHYPSGVIGVFKIPKEQEVVQRDWILVLDEVRDPGNLGTIIRLCDWFGIAQLVCSKGTVDCYNPKVLQATMGSISRVKIKYMDLTGFLQRSSLPMYGAFMDGNVVYEEIWPENGILIMGNEAQGISPEIESMVSKKLGIPQVGPPTTESLNVATATAILLNELRRPSL